MDNKDVQLIGGPCGQHGPYTFYKAFKYTKNGIKRIVTLSEFFFVKMWRDSDLLCIGELQLLWMDKNSEQVLTSLRLYFLPENTPEGRLDHGEDEVLAISEKVVIRLEDLITWITAEAEWTWGRLAKSEVELKNVELDSSRIALPRRANGTSFNLTDNLLDFSDVENEKTNIENANDCSGPHVIILSFAKYCRYRAMMKRLEGVEDVYLKYKIVNALGGFYVKHPNTRVLFCKETFDYPELEGHELLCNHLAPKLKGRPRGKRKKRSVSPCSESNESETSVTNSYNTRAEIKNGLRYNTTITPRRSTRYHEYNENKEFVRKLSAFMKSKHTPIGRIPSLGYKELNLHEFFTKVQKLGGYECVTTNRLWKSIFDDMSGNQNCTSAATIIRRHYERFLLSYERHINGEEHKPLPVSERRRLKSKRGSNNISENETNSCDTTPLPSTSKKTSNGNVNENKDMVKIEGKPSSLRSVRVKQERQKDKKIVTTDKDFKPNITNNNNCNDNHNTPIKENDSQTKSDKGSANEKKDDKIVNNTESVTVKAELLNSDAGQGKNENGTVKEEQPTDNEMEQTPQLPIITEEVEIPGKIEAVVEVEATAVTTDSIKTEECSSVTVETQAVKKQEIKIISETKIEAVVNSNKNLEPLTTAATPIAQKLPSDQLNSPVEGKENIPLIKTGDVASKNSPELVEVPYKSKQPDLVDTESELFHSTFIHEVKKRKLDILKEGGLEVTPVRTTLKNNTIKDSRPSVIHQATPPIQVLTKSLKNDSMPPPITSISSRRTQQSFNLSQVKICPTTPIRKPSPSSSSFQFTNESSPPKVLQSKSIYSYSEKTVYGNPKDILNSPAEPVVPKFISCLPRAGGDPVDLSVNSPQKPVVEIMRVPQVGLNSPYNRDSVTKNLYKSNPSSIISGRKLTPNLEITLVGPSNKSSPTMLKPPNYTSSAQQSSSSQQQSHKRLANEYYNPSKISKKDENGKYRSVNLPVRKSGGHINVPHPFKGSTGNVKIDAVSNQLKQSMSQAPPNMKPFATPNLPAFPPYLPQLYEQAKGLSPYLPMLDPAMYYSAALQSLYSGGALNSSPLLHVPTAEQLKFYTELMAHGRLNFPFPLQDGNPSSVLNNNNFKKS